MNNDDNKNVNKDDDDDDIDVDDICDDVDNDDGVMVIMIIGNNKCI